MSLNQLKAFPAHSVPHKPQRIVLVNPTRYLGNLLVAGGLMQQFTTYCEHEGIELRIVLDDSFKELVPRAFSTSSVIYYPRTRIKSAGLFGKLSLFLQCLREIRQFKADLAFNIEEDTLTSRLTMYSGANFILGCSPVRHGNGYDAVLPIEYAKRPPERSHRWNSFFEVFQAVGLKNAAKAYVRLNLRDDQDSLVPQKLKNCGANIGKLLIGIHPGATKDYKLWPTEHFAKLCTLLLQSGFQPVLIGHGADDEKRCETILQHCENEESTLKVLSLCGQLSLSELALVFTHFTAMIGNDSGPNHLAGAQDLPSVVIFGPSDAEVWGPLASTSRVLQHQNLCEVNCSRKQCHVNRRCLSSISPEEVLTEFLDLLDN